MLREDRRHRKSRSRLQDHHLPERRIRANISQRNRLVELSYERDIDHVPDRLRFGSARVVIIALRIELAWIGIGQ